MKQGDRIRATWDDGLVLEGIYSGSERGYIILKSRSGERIVCHSSHVKFEVINDELSDTQLEIVRGGMNRESFGVWRADLVNGRK